MSQLTNYIQKELDKGFSKALITKKLLQTGYAQQEIDDSFKSLKSAEPLLVRKTIDTIHSDVQIKWSKWVFAMLAIGLLLFFGFLIYLYSTGEKAVVEKNIVSNCDNIVDIREKDICYLKSAANGEDVCDSIIETSFKFACNGKVWMLQDCTYEMLIGENRETCLLQKAIENNDTSYCYHQEDFRECFATLAELSGDIAYCKDNLQCIIIIAVKEKDPSYCKKVFENNSQMSMRCFDFYIEETGDTSFCANASFGCGFEELKTDENKRRYIEENLYKLSSYEQSEIDDELMGFAVEFLDPIFCEYSSETFMYQDIPAKQLCYIAYAYHTQDNIACQLVSQTYISLCEKLQECGVNPNINEICEMIE